jgi:hypothetical protein
MKSSHPAEQRGEYRAPLPTVYSLSPKSFNSFPIDNLTADCLLSHLADKSCVA